MENYVETGQPNEVSAPQQLPAFTPGPWTCSKINALVWRVYRNDAGQRVHQPIVDCSAPTLLAANEKKANAHLIAAAPDMYAAIHNQLSVLNKGSLATDEDLRGAYRALIAALEKAEGAAQ